MGAGKCGLEFTLVPVDAEAIIDCLIFKDSTVQAIAFDDISNHVGQPDRFIWIELKAPDTPTITRMGDELGLHALALEDAISPHQRPKLEEYEGHVFIATRTAQVWESKLELGETHLFVGSTYVVAIRHDSGSAYTRVVDRLQHRPKGIRAATPYALYLVLDLIVDQFRPVIEGMQDRFQSLENQLMTGAKPGRAMLERLYEMKRDLTALGDVADPMQEITLNLIRLHPELCTMELKAYYRDIQDHAVRMSAAIDRLRELEIYAQWVSALERMDVVRLLDPSFSRSGLFKGERIIGVLRELIGDCAIEDLPIAFTAVATDLESGAEVWLREGKLFDAIRASIATPMVFTPFEHRGRMLLDGSLVNPVPITPTVEDTTDLTIAVSLSGRAEPRPSPPERSAAAGDNSYQQRIHAFIESLHLAPAVEALALGTVDTVFGSMETMHNTIGRLTLEADSPDLVIEVPRNACAFHEFWRAQELIALGRERTARAFAASGY